jgi:hypothetical protein
MEKSRNVRCKFYVVSVAQTASQPSTEAATAPVTQEQITLAPVYGDENKPWSKFTPCGQLQLTITNPDVIGQFKPGELFFVDLTPVPAS